VDTLHISMYTCPLTQGFNGLGFELRVNRKYHPIAGVSEVETLKLQTIDLINTFIFVSWEFLRLFTRFRCSFTSSPLRFNYDYATKEDERACSTNADKKRHTNLSRRFI
jgi:hypothetical protein